MGEKVVTKSEGEKNTAAEGAEKAAAAAEGGMTVVLKLDLHCEGCAKKVRRSVAHLQGVVTVKADCRAKILTVTGNVDPISLREKVEIKTKKKVELISPPPNKDAGAGATAAAADNKAEEKKGEETKVDHSQKPKVVIYTASAAVSTVTMKTKLHCDGCAHKIRRIIIKNFDGVDSLTTNLEKDLITVTGTMDVNNLVTFLKEKLKRGVDIILPPPPKHDAAAGEATAKEVPAAEGKEKATAAGGSGGGGEGQDMKKVVKEGDGEGGDKKKEGGGDKKEAESKPESGAGENIKAGGGGAAAGDGEVAKIELSKMEHHSSYNPQTHYAMPMLMHNQSYGHQDYGMHHHQSRMYTAYDVAGPPMPPPTYLDTHANDNVFSDENPNGCHVM